MRTIDRDKYPYTPLFCEENIWWLANSLREEGEDVSQMRVLFFSNRYKQIVMLNQLAANEGHPIIWDYHVVLQLEGADSDWVFDLDSRLPFPVQRVAYFQKTFPDQSSLPEQFRSWVRSIPADSYLEHFFSDRSHMVGKVPESEFPDWPVIQPEANNRRIALNEYWDMDKQLNDSSYTYSLNRRDSTGSLS